MDAALTGPICFTVPGRAVPKQSFRVGKNHHGYTDPRVEAWAGQVAWAAREAMQGLDPLAGPVRVTMDFYLTTRRRMDCDNLAKGVADPMTQAGVWEDDSQIVDLHIRKHYVKRTEGRVVITVDVCAGNPQKEQA